MPLESQQMAIVSMKFENECTVLTVCHVKLKQQVSVTENDVLNSKKCPVPSLAIGYERK